MSHVWAIWNGLQGDPTRSVYVSFPDGADLLAVYGGWLHTFVGVGLARAGLPIEVAYSGALCFVLGLTGVGGVALARAFGLGAFASGSAGLLLQLDGWLLYNATDGRPEHGGVGLVALGLAGALASWRGEGGRFVPVLTGVAGAMCFVAGWEQGTWLVVAIACCAPFLGRPPAGAWRRWGVALGVGVLLGAPWMGTFLVRALAVRAPAEGTEMIHHALDQSLTPLQWLRGAGRHPSRLGMAAMLALPWLARRGDRRLWVGIGLGLVLSLVLAMGPQPGLERPADLGIWGPFVWMQQLPVLGWFHSPARLALGFSFVSVLSAAMCVDRALRRSAWLAVPLGVAFLGSAVWEVRTAGDWPMGGFQVPVRPDLELIARAPGPGAVLDLPAATQNIFAQEYELQQLTHHRPIAGHPWLPWLATDTTARAMAAVPLLAWSAVPEGDPPKLREEDRAWLLDQGYRFVALSPRWLPRGQEDTVVAGFRTVLGKPVAEGGRRWLCWDLGER